MLCKHKKVVFFTFALGLWMFSFSVKAQTMNVHLADTVVSFNVADITSITFEEEQVKAVDLGLSVLWADCNLGADAPEGYGDYFGWGETETKSYYSWSYYPYYVPTYTSSSKPTLPLEEYEGETVIPAPYDQLPCRRLPLKYDAANSILGGKWRMPTSQEQKALCDSCTWTWTTRNKVGGYEVKGPSGKSIFLPASGAYMNGSVEERNNRGLYWSSTVLTYDDAKGRSYYLLFMGSMHDVNASNRYIGMPVRAVKSRK